MKAKTARAGSRDRRGYQESRTAPYHLTELALAMGAPAPGFFDNTPAGEIAAMVPGAIAGGALTAAGVPALEFARDISIAAATRTILSPETIQAGQSFTEGLLGPPTPTVDPFNAAGQVTQRILMQWWNTTNQD